MIVSMTRLRLRSWRQIAGFTRHTAASLRQAIGVAGFLDGRLLAGRLTFWTVTRWSSDDAMREWRATGAHARAMPFLMDWCDEASVARWEQPDGAPFPTWQDCHRRMADQGRASLVRQPSDTQKAGAAPKPPGQGVRLVLPFRRVGRA
jgi:hypothetical protein